MPTTRSIHQRDQEKEKEKRKRIHMYKKKIIAAPFVVAKNWKLRGCPSIGECLIKLWFVNVLQ